MIPPPVVPPAIISFDGIAKGDLVRAPNSGLGNKISLASGLAGNQLAIGYAAAAAVTDGPVTIFVEGIINTFSGLLLGRAYFLSNVTRGGVSLTPANGSGQRAQFIGFAISATEIVFHPNRGVMQA